MKKCRDGFAGSPFLLPYSSAISSSFPLFRWRWMMVFFPFFSRWKKCSSFLLLSLKRTTKNRGKRGGQTTTFTQTKSAFSPFENNVLLCTFSIRRHVPLYAKGIGKARLNLVVTISIYRLVIRHDNQSTYRQYWICFPLPSSNNLIWWPILARGEDLCYSFSSSRENGAILDDPDMAKANLTPSSCVMVFPEIIRICKSTNTGSCTVCSVLVCTVWWTTGTVQYSTCTQRTGMCINKLKYCYKYVHNLNLV